MALEFEKEAKLSQDDVNYLETEPEEEDLPDEDEPVDDSDDEAAAEPEKEVDPFAVDLFGNPIVTKSKNKSTTPSKDVKKPEKKDKLYDTEWLIFYAGHRLTVPEDGLLLDQVRAYLELEFPELSKERTEMLTDDDKKQIIPVVKGAKKG